MECTEPDILAFDCDLLSIIYTNSFYLNFGSMNMRLFTDHGQTTLSMILLVFSSSSSSCEYLYFR